jgi:hypothetical protein
MTAVMDVLPTQHHQSPNVIHLTSRTSPHH